MCLNAYIAFNIMSELYVYDLVRVIQGLLIVLVAALILIIVRLLSDIKLLRERVKSLGKLNADLLEILNMKPYLFEDTTLYYLLKVQAKLVKLRTS